MHTPHPYSRKNPPRKRKDTVLIIAGERSGELGFVTGIDLERELAEVWVLAVGECVPRLIPFSDLAEPNPLVLWFWPDELTPRTFWFRFAGGVLALIIVTIPLAIWILYGV